MEAVPFTLFELLKAQTVQNADSRDVTPRTLVQMCRRLDSFCGLHIERGRMLLEMKPGRFFETYIPNRLHDVAFQNIVATKQTAMCKRYLVRNWQKIGKWVKKCSLLWYCNNHRHTNMHTYIHTYLLIYILTYLHTYLHIYLLTYIHTYLLIYILTYLHRYLLTYILTYLFTYLLIYLFT